MTVTINGTTGIANDGGYTGDGVVFADTTPANTLVTTTGGNVGIGTSSPSTTLHLSRSGTGDYTSLRMSNTGASGRSYEIGVGGNTSGSPYANNLYFYDATASATRMLLDSSGNLLVGTTSSFTGGNYKAELYFASGGGLAIKTGTNGDYGQTFRNSSGTQVGFIAIGASATTYSTSSDYRLKENIAPMTGALDKVAQLKPCTYNWKLDGEASQGFIAHELQEVVPECVVGEKDAVDADGNPVYQGIDTSFLVATLTAAIQELKAIVDAQGAEIAALKGTA